MLGMKCVIAIVLFLVASAFGQTPAIKGCTLMMAQAPTVGGVRLGESVEEVEKKIKGFADKFKEAEKYQFDDPLKGEVHVGSLDVGENGLLLLFRNRKVVRIQLMLTSREPTNLADLTKEVQSKYRLPVDGWKQSPSESYLNCYQFWVLVRPGDAKRTFDLTGQHDLIQIEENRFAPPA